MTELSSKDYKNIIDFQNSVNKDCSNYENVVLFSLNALFNLKLTAFGIFKRGDNGAVKDAQFISNSIGQDMLEYLRAMVFKNKDFVQGFTRLCYSKPNSTYITDEDLIDAGLLSPDIIKVFKSINVFHTAIIGVNGAPGKITNLLLLFKASDRNDFTEYEKTLFQYIGRAFNNSIMIHKKYLHWQRRFEAVSSYFDEMPFGFAVVDGKKRILYCSSVFVTLSAKISSGLTKMEIIEDIFSIADANGKIPSDNYYSIETYISGLILTIQKKRAALSLRTETLYFISLRRENVMQASQTDSTALSAKFGLTKREGEVAYLLAKGYNNQDISGELYIGLSTVKTHIGSIYSKLMVNSRSELIKKLRSEIE